VRKPFLPLALALGVSTASVSAMMVAMPKSAVVAGSDLVVVGKVAANKDSAEQEVRLPGMKKAYKRYMQPWSIEVSEVLMDLGSAHRAGEKIQVIALAKKPQPKQPGMMIHLADGPSYPSLRAGTAYAMALRKLGDKPGLYYLPADPRYFVIDSPQTKERVESMRKMANVASWPWGKVVDGLQLAVMPDDQEIRMYKARKGRNGPEFTQAQMLFAAVVRNVTEDRTIAIPHYAFDKFLTLSLTAEGKPELKKDLYTGVRFQQEEFAAKHVTKIQPGAMAIIARYGASPWGDHVMLQDLPAGAAVLRCGFTAKREQGPDGGVLWKGTLTSGDTPLSIVLPANR